MLEFGTFSKKNFARSDGFLDRLHGFLAALPAEWRYGVEIRNPAYLGPEYLRCLRAHSVAHVLNAWTRMPEFGTQLEIPGIVTTDFTVTRSLLKHGRSYPPLADET